MFGPRFFGVRFFGPHYWGSVNGNNSGAAVTSHISQPILTLGRMMGR